MAKQISDEQLRVLVNRAADLLEHHNLALAKRLLLQVPPSQLLSVVHDFRGLPR